MEETPLPITASNMEKVVRILNQVWQYDHLPAQIQTGIRFAMDVIETESLHKVTLKTLEAETAPKRRGAVDHGHKSLDSGLTEEMLDADVTRWFNSEFSGQKVK